MKDENTKLGQRVSTHTMLLNGVLVVFKLIIGLLARSSVLVADAFHSLTDILSTVFVYYGITISNKPPDEEHPYGHEKAELIVSKIIALFLMFAAVGIGFEAYSSLLRKDYANHSVWSIVVVVVSVVLNEFMFYYSVHVGKKINSKSLIADGWHHRSDSLSSAAALIGVLGSMFGYGILDPISALLVAVIILRQGLKIYFESVQELMDTAPSKKVMDEIKEVFQKCERIDELDNVKAIFHLNHIELDAHVVVDPKMTIEEGMQIRLDLKKRLREEIANLEEITIILVPNTKKQDVDKP